MVTHTGSVPTCMSVPYLFFILTRGLWVRLYHCFGNHTDYAGRGTVRVPGVLHWTTTCTRSSSTCSSSWPGARGRALPRPGALEGGREVPRPTAATLLVSLWGWRSLCMLLGFLVGPSTPPPSRTWSPRSLTWRRGISASRKRPITPSPPSCSRAPRARSDCPTTPAAVQHTVLGAFRPGRGVRPVLPLYSLAVDEST